MRGWLSKRGPLLQWSWEKRWCVLAEHDAGEPDGTCRPSDVSSDDSSLWLLEYFEDESCVVKKGDIILHNETRAVRFKGDESAGDGIKHVRERPFGFTLDVDSTAGRDRHMYYFDAQDCESLEAWISAITSAATEAFSCSKSILQSYERHRHAARSSIVRSRSERGELDGDEFGEDDVEVLPVSVAASERSLLRHRLALSAEAYGEWNNRIAMKPKPVPKTLDQRQSILAALQRSPFYVDLIRRQDDLQIAIDAFERRDADAGAEVIRQGDTEDQNFYILESGSIDIFLVRDPKHDIFPGRKVRTLRGGVSFGELALLHHAPRAATLIAKERCKLWSLRADAFQYVMRDSAMRTRETHFSFLRSIKLLERLSDSQVGNLLDAVTMHYFKKEDFIVRAGELGDCFYVVEDGEAMARINGMDARSYKRGAYFGELSLLNDRPRAADVVAASDTLTVVSVDRGSFERVLGKGVLFPKATQGAPVLMPAAGAAKSVAKGKEHSADAAQKKKKGLRFADTDHESSKRREVDSTIQQRKGTGFVSVDQLQKLLATSTPAGSIGGERPGVTFADASDNNDSALRQHRKGTGYVRADQLKKLLEDHGDAKKINFDAVVNSYDSEGAVGQAGLSQSEDQVPPRRGTGFISVEQLQKLLEDTAECHDEVGEQKSVHFDNNAATCDNPNKVQRQDTGFIDVSMLKALLEEAMENPEELEESSVRYDSDAAASDAPAAPPLRRGTGYIDTAQLRRLLSEADHEDGGDTSGNPGDSGGAGIVRFVDGVGGEKAGGGGGLSRRGTGFVQTGQLRKLIADAGEESEAAGQVIDAALRKLLAEVDLEASGDVAAAGDGDAVAAENRKGTGFVHKDQLKKLLADADSEASGGVHFEPSTEYHESKGSVRRGTGFIQSDQALKLEADSQAGAERVGGVTFDASAKDSESRQSFRRGTGYINAEQARKLVTERDDEVAGVRFDSSAQDNESSQSMRRGTGFIQAEQAGKLAFDDSAGSVHFDASIQDNESKGNMRRGTGFIQAEQAKKLASEASSTSSGAVQFDASAEDNESRASIRRGTGFIHAEQARKLATDTSDEVEGIRFDESAKDNESRQSMRRGTGFIQADQASKLAGDTLDGAGGVQFDASVAENSSKQSLRRGTGFVQAKQLDALSAADAIGAEGTTVDESASAQRSRARKSLERKVSFSSTVKDQPSETSRGSRPSIHTAGEIYVSPATIERMSEAE